MRSRRLPIPIMKLYHSLTVFCTIICLTKSIEYPRELDGISKNISKPERIFITNDETGNLLLKKLWLNPGQKLNTITERKLKQTDTIYETSKRKKRSILQKIYPGTKWCGPGNIAENESDFGEEIETDKCCHEHDKCKMFIGAGEIKWTFKNKFSHTLMSCGCDDEFYLCLKEVDNRVSDKVGNLFFNVLQVKCFQREVIKTCVSWYVIGIWCRKYQRQLGIKLYNSQNWN